MAIAESMHEREDDLLQSPCICAALYLDPRFRLCIIASGRKRKAVRNIEALHDRLVALQGDSASEADRPVPESEGIDVSDA